MVEDLPCFGRPSTSNTDENMKKVKEMVLENRHASLRELSIYYLSVLKRLRDAVRVKWPEIWADSFWILHDDNVPSHRTRIVLNY